MAIATYVGSEVHNQKPNIVYVEVSQPLDTSIDTTGFTVSVNAGGNVVSSVLVGQDSNVIAITLSVDVVTADSLTVAYAGGGDIVSATGGEALATFTAQAVTNSVLLDIMDADPSLVTGAYSATGIDISYNATGSYTTIEQTHMQTPSILRSALQEAGLYFDGDRRGTWSIIKSARDYIQVSLDAA